MQIDGQANSVRGVFAISRRQSPAIPFKFLRSYKVLNKNALPVHAALVLVAFFNASAAPAHEDPQCYTVASVEGTYAIVGTYGANVALALGLRHFDGNGNLTGTFTLNEPTPGSTTGGRTIVTGTQIGTYTVNCDGTGVITRTVTSSTGVVATQTDDFVITRAAMKTDHLIATALEDAQRTPSAIVAGGIFLTRRYTRLPDAHWQ
jgi:hypothetical protein